MAKRGPVTAWLDEQPETDWLTPGPQSHKTQLKLVEKRQMAAVQGENVGSLFFLYSTWGENSSWGGVPNIVRNKYWIWKIIWGLLVSTGLCMCLTFWQVWQVFDKYYAYPVNINVNVTYTNKIDFPTITVCNLNIIRHSQVKFIPEQYIPLLMSLLGNRSAISTPDRLKQTELFQQVYNSMDLTTRKLLGHQQQDMIMDCMFNGKACDFRNILTWNNPVYGNCHTFNAGFYFNTTSGVFVNMPVLESYRTGPTYGLTLEIFIEEDEYIPELTEAVGVKVVIANQGAPMFPGDTGIYLAPAMYSSITLQKINITRLPAPYPSNCMSITSRSETIKIDSYVEAYNTDYDISSCLKSCYQSYVLEECGCGDPKMPRNTQAAKTRVGNKTATYPPCNTWATVRCQHNISVRFGNDELNCRHCRMSCIDISYTSQLSTAMWPTAGFLKQKLAHMSSISPKFAANMVNKTNPQSNMLKLNAHFEELNYEVIYETAAYTTSSILSDIGGTIGLWLGISVVAIFEIVQLGVDTIMTVIFILLSKEQKKREAKIGVKHNGVGKF